MEKINLAILDDHQLINEAIKDVFTNHEAFNFISSFSSFTELTSHKALLNNQIDVLLLDVELKEENGIDCCKWLKKEYPKLKIVMLTSHNNKNYALKAIKNGASGYLVKNITKNELFDELMKIVNGELILDKSIDFVSIPHKKAQLNFNPKLTNREKEILKLIVDEYTTAEIAERLFISKHTVESHRSNLLIKTGAKNIAGLIRITFEENLL